MALGAGLGSVAAGPHPHPSPSRFTLTLHSHPPPFTLALALRPHPHPSPSRLAPAPTRQVDAHPVPRLEVDPTATRQLGRQHQDGHGGQHGPGRLQLRGVPLDPALRQPRQEHQEQGTPHPPPPTHTTPPARPPALRPAPPASCPPTRTPYFDTRMHTAHAPRTHRARHLDRSRRSTRLYP